MLIIMKNINKIINFFTTQYYDNIKYNNYTASLLKIFFERANKVTSNISTLGNVYRNSKWSDLKIQNIKVLHVRSFLFMSLSFTSVLIFIFFIYRSDLTITYTLASFIIWTWSYATDLLSYSIAVFFLAFYNLYNWATLRFSLALSKLFTTPVLVKPISVQQLPNTSTPTLSSNLLSESINLSSLDSFTGLAAHHMFKLKFFIDTSDRNALTISTYNSIGISNTTPISLFFNSGSASQKLSSNFNFSVTALEHNFLSSVSSSVTNSTSKISLSQGKLSQLHTNFNLFSPLYSSINSSLLTAKQYRWLIRSMPISEGMSISNNLFTQSKLLMDNAIWGSNLATLNVWASSKAPGIDLTSISKSYYINTLTSQPQMSNINFFEDSRNFLLKKSYYSMQPQYTTSNLSNILTTAFTNTTSVNTNLSMNNSIISDISFFYSNQTLSSSPHNLISQLYYDPNCNNYFNSNDHLVYYKSSFNNFLMDLNTTSAHSKVNTLYYNFTTKSNQNSPAKLAFKY